MFVKWATNPLISYIIHQISKAVREHLRETSLKYIKYISATDNINDTLLELIPRLWLLQSHQKPENLTTPETKPRKTMRFSGQWWSQSDRNQGINFYHAGIQSITNMQMPQWLMLEITLKLPWLQHDYRCAADHCPMGSGDQIVSQVVIGNVCCNHCDVTTWLVKLNFGHTLNRNMQQITH